MKKLCISHRVMDGKHHVRLTSGGQFVWEASLHYLTNQTRQSYWAWFGYGMEARPSPCRGLEILDILYSIAWDELCDTE